MVVMVVVVDEAVTVSLVKLLKSVKVFALSLVSAPDSTISIDSLSLPVVPEALVRIFFVLGKKINQSAFDRERSEMTMIGIKNLLSKL